MITDNITVEATVLSLIHTQFGLQVCNCYDGDIYVYMSVFIIIIQLGC